MNIGTETELLKPPYYVCPITGDLFPDNEVFSIELSEEHVPPKSLGGKVLCLTHERANVSYGKFEKYLFKRSNNVVNYRDTRKTNYKAYLKDSSAELTFDFSKDTPRLEFITPYVTEQRVQDFMNNGKFDFFLDDAKHNPGVRAAYIKSAYLKAFSLLGYPYLISGPQTGLFHPNISMLTNAILEKDFSVLKDIHVIEEYEGVPIPNDISLIQTSSDNIYLAVCMTLGKTKTHKSVVFLPTLIDSDIIPLDNSMLKQDCMIHYFPMPSLNDETNAFTYWEALVALDKNRIKS